MGEPVGSFIEPRRVGRPPRIDMEARMLANPIVAFTPAMVDEWMLSRLEDRWPGYTEATWRGKFAGFSGSNDYLFVTNGDSVLLMMKMAHQITMKPVIMEIFGWSRSAIQTKDGVGNWWFGGDYKRERPLFDLYRHAKGWMKGMSAVRIIAGTCSDLAPSRLKEGLGGVYLVDVHLDD